MPPFCIIGTPRSRTSWFSKFLTHGDIACDHEPSKFWKTTDDIGRYFSTNTGASDSGLTFRYHDLIRLNVKAVAIVRPIEDVVKSLIDIGIPATQEAVKPYYDHIDSFPSCISTYHYDKLGSPELCEIFRWATGKDCEIDWLLRWKSQIVNPDIQNMLHGVDVASSLDFYLKGQ